MKILDALHPRGKPLGFFVPIKEEEEFVNGRNRLLKRMEEELSPRNCPAEEIVSRFRSVIKDKYFPVEELKRQYNNHDLFHEAMDKLKEREWLKVKDFLGFATVNAPRVPPEDAVDFVRTLFVNNTFDISDCGWSEKEETKFFLSHGMVPLADNVNPEDKVKFFRACETKWYLKILIEEGNPQDAAAFLYNVFGEMKANEVDSVLAQSDIMELIPMRGNAEEYTKAFEAHLQPHMDSRLPYVFKKSMGWSPETCASFEDHYPSNKDGEPEIGHHTL